MNNFKEMIRLSIIGFIALVVMGIMMYLFSSCGNYKSAMKKENLVQVEDSNRQIIDFGFTSVRDITSFINSSVNKKINWKLYDTNKPKDPDTGKYPLLAEGDAEENNEIKHSTTITVEDSISIKSDSASFSRRQEYEMQEKQAQREETTVPKQISGIIWASCVLLMIIVWIIYKSKKGG